MRAGELTERVQIDQRTIDMDSPESDGSFVSGWQTLRTVWAKVERIAPGREALFSGALHNPAIYKVTVRWMVPILSPAEHRFQWSARILDIMTVDDITLRNQALIMTCQEGLTRG